MTTTSADDTIILIHECPKIFPSMPSTGSRVGRLVPCAKCNDAVFRDNTWDDADAAIKARFDERGEPRPRFVEWCYECQLSETMKRDGKNQEEYLECLNRIRAKHGLVPLTAETSLWTSRPEIWDKLPKGAQLKAVPPSQSTSERVKAFVPK